MDKLLPEKEGSGVKNGIFLPGDLKGLTSKLNLLLAEFRAGNTSTRNDDYNDEEEQVLDSQKIEVGFRTTSWKKHGSFMLNEEYFKLRGFSHHNSIGGLGVAIVSRSTSLKKLKSVNTDLMKVIKIKKIGVLKL